MNGENEATSGPDASDRVVDRDASSTREGGSPLPQSTAPTKDSTLSVTPNLSTNASSVTLAVNDHDVAVVPKDGKTTSPTLTGQEDSKPAVTPKGWPSRSPFRCDIFVGKNGVERVKEKGDLVFWVDLTWKQKNAWRKAFLAEYLSETRKCLPSVMKLYMMIYQLSRWRAVVLIMVSIFRGFLPALTLQTRGNFIMMVIRCLNLAE